MRSMRKNAYRRAISSYDDEIIQDQIKKLDRLYDFNMTRPTQLDKRNAERDTTL